ncbi:MAG: flagellar hook-length control protein FliK [Planctomycetota bacterium]|jgi:flagellar hook-length control protein FliK
MIQPSLLLPSPTPAASPATAELRSQRTDDRASFRTELDRRRSQPTPEENAATDRETAIRDESAAARDARETSRHETETTRDADQEPAVEADPSASNGSEGATEHASGGGESGRTDTGEPVTNAAQSTPDTAQGSPANANPAPGPAVTPTDVVTPIRTTEGSGSQTATTATNVAGVANATTVSTDDSLRSSSVAPERSGTQSIGQSGAPTTGATDRERSEQSVPRSASGSATGSVTASATASATGSASATAPATTPATATDTAPAPVLTREPVTSDASRQRRQAPTRPVTAEPGTPTPTTTNTASAASPEPTLPENMRELTELRVTTPASETTPADRDGAPRPAPAVGRALQVDTTVKLEQVAQQMQTAAAARVAAPATPNVTVAAQAASLTPQVVDELLSTDPARVDDARVTGRVMRGLATMVNQRGGAMSMRLSPPELGALRVQMTITQGTVSAQFTAATEQAQSLLSRNLASLRSSLESHGLNVERLGVQMAPGESSNTTRAGDGDSQSGPRQDGEHDAAGRESQGRRDQDDADGRDPAARAWSPRSRTVDPAAFPELLSIGGDA